MSIIECNNLTKSYKDVNALDNMSFSINENKITGLIGRNGAGKTTLLNLSAGFIKPSKGTIKVFSKNPFNSLLVSSNLFFCHNNMSFANTITLGGILKSAKCFYKNYDSNLSKNLFEYFNLNKNSVHSRLSKGMKSTFNMILAVSSHCPITLMDEPTDGMDSAVRKNFYRVILKDYMNYPRTIIISSHLLSEIENLIEDILLIDSGKMLLYTQAQALKGMYVNICGNSDSINKLLEGKEFIHKEITENITSMVVKNDFSDKELSEAKILGITFNSVSVDDICVYLSSKKKGDIDDVFKQC